MVIVFLNLLRDREDLKRNGIRVFTVKIKGWGSIMTVLTINLTGNRWMKEEKRNKIDKLKSDLVYT